MVFISAAYLFNNVHVYMYIFAYLSEWFLVWCNHVLYLRVEISECFYSSEAADLCNINCDILVPSDFNIYHFHCWCNLSELTSAFFFNIRSNSLKMFYYYVFLPEIESHLLL